MIVWTEQVIFWNTVCTYTYMHATTVSEKRSRELERERGRVHGKVWRE